MDEAENLADRIAVIAGGRIVAEGTPGSLGGRDRMEAMIRFTLPEGTGVGGLPEPLRLLARPGHDGRVTLSTDEPLRNIRDLADWALANDLDLHDLEVRRPTLEDVYLSLTAEPVEAAR
jgi:ABC-2 type transport system ATP-binding protein